VRDENNLKTLLSGDRPGGDLGASGAAGDRGYRRVLVKGDWFRGVDDRAIGRPAHGTVPRGDLPSNREASGEAHVTGGAPTEQSDDERTGRAAPRRTG
jgi:hypothetical protein